MVDISWLDKGVRFGCTACGECCRTHGEYAFVYLSDTDVTAISDFLGMRPASFLSTHCASDKVGNIHLAEMTGDCAFLEADNRCQIYPVRPKQCATWPFWTENLPMATWHGPVMACCEGIGEGRRYTKEEILALCKERDDWYD